jgi:hypothetical protein
MSRGTSRAFSREFVRRTLPGNNVSARARELQVRRKDLNAWRGAKAEGFIKTLTQEHVDGRAHHDVDEARRMIGTFIERV